ncbi:MAG TPA: nuclear transport factor 2 family protein [Gemmatimonadaceae bacterium]|nr:nuclear transport factor 2 family protein [Gemmatimonadaceae bacterium]
MAEGPIETQLADFEKQYWQAIKDRDVQAAMRLTDDPCIVTGAQGVARISRQAFAGMLQAEGWTLHQFDLSDLQVRLLGDDVAIIAYKVKEVLTVEGKPVTLEAADSSTWVRRDGQWLCALHTEAVLGDPFGRDRRPVAGKS